MNVSSLTWFDDDDPRDLRRWAIAALVVLGVHLAAIAAYVYVHRPDEIGDDMTPIAVDFSPTDDTVDQPEVAPTPEQPPPEVEKPPPPPPPEPQAVARPRNPAATAEGAKSRSRRRPPCRRAARAARRTSPQRGRRAWCGIWSSSSAIRARRRTHGEEGVVLLSFSVDRTGHVLEHRVARSSGYPALDDEVMSMIERAQPLPPFPATMTEDKLDLTVPIRFSLK